MKNFINLLIGFGLIGLIIYFIFRMLAWFYNQVLSVDPRISAALIAGVITIVATSLTITIPRHFQKKMEIESHLRDQKSDAYKQLLELLFKILMGAKMGEPLSDKDLTKQMSKFTESLILWGSEDVIKSYRDFRKYFMHRKPNGNLSLDEINLLENLLLTIRKDMGHKNKNLQQGDILSLFINDIDDILNNLKVS